MGFQGRIAIAGFGVRGRQWATATAKAGHALVAVVETDAGRRSDVPAPAYTSIEAALDAVQPDLVVLATPPAAHAEQARVVIERGIAVLCEKPLCESVVEAAELVRATRERDGMLLVGMNFRFLPVSIRLRRLVAEATLGPPMFSRFGYLRNRDGRRADLNSFPLTMTQPMLMEQSVHHIDLLRFVLGREVLAVRAHTWNPPTSVYRDDSCVAALLEFDGDFVVDYTGTWTAGSDRLEFEWRIDFERGVTFQAGQFGGLSMAKLVPGAALTGPIFDERGEPRRRLRLRATTPFLTDTIALLDHAMRAVGGIEAPGPTAGDHLQTLAVLDAIAEAARTGDRVVVIDRARAIGIHDAMT